MDEYWLDGFSRCYNMEGLYQGKILRSLYWRLKIKIVKQTQAKGGLDFISADTIPPWAWIHGPQCTDSLLILHLLIRQKKKNKSWTALNSHKLHMHIHIAQNFKIIFPALQVSLRGTLTSIVTSILKYWVKILRYLNWNLMYN